VTHILNVTCKSYSKRSKYFKYLDIQIHDDIKEDSKKHYRTTNRFIQECLSEGGKLLVQSVEGKSRCAAFILAYMIKQHRMKLRDALSNLR
jgi:protein-tyrosine phosphatase